MKDERLKFGVIVRVNVKVRIKVKVILQDFCLKSKVLSNQRHKGFHGFCFYVKISAKGLQKEAHRQAQTCLQHVGEPLTAHSWHTDALHKSCFYCFFSILCELCSLRVRLIAPSLIREGWGGSLFLQQGQHDGGIAAA